MCAEAGREANAHEDDNDKAAGHGDARIRGAPVYLIEGSPAGIGAAEAAALESPR